MPCFSGNGNGCLGRRWHGGDGCFCFIIVIGHAPFAGFAAEGGGVVGAEVVFDGVPEVEDEGIDDGALVADGFLADVVGGFGGGLGDLRAVEGAEGGFSGGDATGPEVEQMAEWGRMEQEAVVMAGTVYLRRAASYSIFRILYKKNWAGCSSASLMRMRKVTASLPSIRRWS